MLSYLLDCFICLYIVHITLNSKIVVILFHSMDQTLHKQRIRIITILIMHLEMLNNFTHIILMMCLALLIEQLNKDKRRKLWDSHDRHLVREVNFERIVFISDLACIENTRMDRRAFHVLCNMLKGVGKLEPSKNMSVEEMVAMFLHIIAHDVKNRVVKRQFMRSQETVSRRFNDVLLAVLRCHNHLLKQPQPIGEDSTDERWKWFKVIN